MASPSPVSLAIDAGTTGVRSLVVDSHGAIVDVAYRELTQYFPRPGWVEHNADEIWQAVQSTLAEVARRLPDEQRIPMAIGITNQRETVVAWDRGTGRPLHRALVWQDRRTAAACDALVAQGHLPLVRERTGLVLDPYFSATKMRWLLTEGEIAPTEHVALATVDSWILWNLTGGANGTETVFATDVTNASRTLLFDIVERQWSDELCDLFRIPAHVLPEARPSCGRFGRADRAVVGEDSPLAGVPISGIAGDQHAALFGQACFDRGMAKVTYGTGSFVLVNAGGTCPPPVEGLLTTLAWDLGTAGATAIGADGDHSGGSSPVAYALEGSVFASGSAVQWLRDGPGIIAHSSDIEPLALRVNSSEGVSIVPAFTGLGSPHWDPYARGTVTGLSRGIGRAHLARAVIEAMSFQVRDVIDAMARSGTDVSALRVDGGASVMGLLLQHQADQVQIPVSRPRSVETTALGAATLAGLAEGMWGSLRDLEQLWEQDVQVQPTQARELADAAHGGWLRAVDRSRRWASDE